MLVLLLVPRARTSNLVLVLAPTSAGYGLILPSMGVLETTIGLVDPQTAAVTTAVLTDHCLQATFTYRGKPTLSPTFLDTHVVSCATF